MRRSSLPPWTAWLLLVTMLGPWNAVPSKGRREACACGKVSPCCCRMIGGSGMGGAAGARAPQNGDACAIRRPSGSCNVRSSDGPALRTRIDLPVGGASAWLSLRRLLPPLDRRGSAALGHGAALLSLAGDPVTPPPKPEPRLRSA